MNITDNIVSENIIENRLIEIFSKLDIEEKTLIKILEINTSLSDKRLNPKQYTQTKLPWIKQTTNIKKRLIPEHKPKLTQTKLTFKQETKSSYNCCIKCNNFLGEDNFQQLCGNTFCFNDGEI